MRPAHPTSFGAMTIASYGRAQIVGGQGEGLDREGAGAGGLIPGCLQLVHRFSRQQSFNDLMPHLHLVTDFLGVFLRKSNCLRSSQAMGFPGKAPIYKTNQIIQISNLTLLIGHGLG